MRLNALLTAERARNEKLLSELQTLVGLSESQIKAEKTSPSQIPPPQTQPQTQTQKKSPFAFLHDKGSLTDGGSESPLSTNTAFTLSQMQALRALSTSLLNLTPDLLPPARADESSAMDIDNNEEGSGKKSWRRERLEYVEGATRRYLERVEGLELGKHGEVRDGEWQGEGRNLARDEVGGLEQVITILGGEPEEESNAAAAGGASSRDDDDRMDES